MATKRRAPDMKRAQERLKMRAAILSVKERKEKAAQEEKALRARLRSM